MRVSLKNISALVLALACASAAQLMSAVDHSADTVRLDNSAPLVLSPDARTSDIKALDDSVSTVNAEPTLEETAKSAVINKGIELLSETLKNSLSPNSPEADAAEKALDFR